MKLTRILRALALWQFAALIGLSGAWVCQGCSTVWALAFLAPVGLLTFSGLCALEASRKGE